MTAYTFRDTCLFVCMSFYQSFSLSAVSMFSSSCMFAGLPVYLTVTTYPCASALICLSSVIFDCLFIFVLWIYTKIFMKFLYLSLIMSVNQWINRPFVRSFNSFICPFVHSNSKPISYLRHHWEKQSKVLTAPGGDEISCRTLSLTLFVTPTASDLMFLFWTSATVAFSWVAALFGTPSVMIITVLGTSGLSPFCGTNMSDRSNWYAPVVFVSPPVYTTRLMALNKEGLSIYLIDDHRNQNILWVFIYGLYYMRIFIFVLR